MVERAKGDRRDPLESRQQCPQCAAVTPQLECPLRMLDLLHRLLQLLLHAFGGETAEVRRAFDDGLPGPGIDSEIEEGRETNRSQRPKKVLSHTTRWLHGCGEAHVATS